MNTHASVMALIALTLSVGCAPDSDQIDRAASILAPSMADAVLYGTADSTDRNAKYHFKGDPWVGQVRGELTRRGSSPEDWRYDLGLDAFGDADMNFTGDMQIDTHVDSDFGMETLTLTGEVDPNGLGSMDVDLEIDITDEDAYTAVEWIGEINGEQVEGKSEQRHEVDADFDECRTPIGIDCG